jgi:hypothetical protein
MVQNHSNQYHLLLKKSRSIVGAFLPAIIGLANSPDHSLCI